MPRPWPRRCRRTGRSRGARCRRGGARSARRRSRTGSTGAVTARRWRAWDAARRWRDSGGGRSFEQSGVRHDDGPWRRGEPRPGRPGKGSGVLLSARGCGLGWRGIRMRVIDARTGASGTRSCRVQKRRTSPAGVTVLVAHSTTHDSAAGHHHASSPVRLPGGQRTRVVSHVPDYDGWRHNASNRTGCRVPTMTKCDRLLNHDRHRQPSGFGELARSRVVPG